MNLYMAVVGNGHHYIEAKDIPAAAAVIRARFPARELQRITLCATEIIRARREGGK